MHVAQQVEQLVQKKAEAPKHLRQQAEREWREIHDGTLRFDRVDQDIAALRKLTRSDLLTFYQVVLDLMLSGHCTDAGIVQVSYKCTAHQLRACC